MNGAEEPRGLFSFDYQIELEFNRKSITPCLVSVYRQELLPTDTIKIGFFGGSGEPDLSGNVGIGVNRQSLEFARRTGEYIAYHNQHYEPKILPITGAAPGNPHAFAEAAAENGTWPVGLSPFFDEEHHLDNGSHTNAYAAIIYMGLDKQADFKSRRGEERMNVQFGLRDGYNVLAAHCGIYDGGDIGTYNEFIINLILGKDLAVAKGCGGLVEDFVRKKHKDTGSNLIYSKDPPYIVRRLIELQEKREENNGKRQKLFIDDIVSILNKEIKKRKSIS